MATEEVTVFAENLIGLYTRAGEQPTEITQAEVEKMKSDYSIIQRLVEEERDKVVDERRSWIQDWEKGGSLGTASEKPS